MPIAFLGGPIYFPKGTGELGHKFLVTGLSHYLCVYSRQSTLRLPLEEIETEEIQKKCFSRMLFFPLT